VIYLITNLTPSKSYLVRKNDSKYDISRVWLAHFKTYQVYEIRDSHSSSEKDSVLWDVTACSYQCCEIRIASIVRVVEEDFKWLIVADSAEYVLHVARRCVKSAETINDVLRFI
jgi:hypothetical protein